MTSVPNSVFECRRVILRLSRIASVVAFLVIAGGLAHSQQPSDKPATPQQSSPTTGQPNQTNAAKTTDSAAAPATAADPRQAQIEADTQKLLKLSQELKAEVAKSSKDTLSLSVIKKAEEVEKLARTLKEELKKDN
jgi:hypothetical protein